MDFKINIVQFGGWIFLKCARLRGSLTGDGLFAFFGLLAFNTVSLKVALCGKLLPYVLIAWAGAWGQAFLGTASTLCCHCGVNFLLLGPTETNSLWSVAPEWKIELLKHFTSHWEFLPEGRVELPASHLLSANGKKSNGIAGRQMALLGEQVSGLSVVFASGSWHPIHSLQRDCLRASAPALWVVVRS